MKTLTLVLIVIAIVFITVIGILAINIRLEFTENCKKVGGSVDKAYMECLKEVDGEWREGVPREINGKLEFVVGGGE